MPPAEPDPAVPSPGPGVDPWQGLLDDAATFPPGNADLGDALAAYDARRNEWYADLVGSFVLRDTDLGSAPAEVPVSVVLTTGAGGIDGVAGLAARKGLTLAGLEVALRDVHDLAGNARRVVAAVDQARAAGTLDESVPVYVELPQTDATHGWLSAADEVAAAELRIKLRTGGVDAAMFPTAPVLASWIDAALDRETPFKCTAGLHHAVRHTASKDFDVPVDQHGFLNVLLATEALFDGAGTDEAVALLELRATDALVARVRRTDVPRTRRWFTSHGSCSVTDPLDDLIALGLLEGPTDD